MKKLLIIMFIAIPVVFSAIIFISPDKEMSENENRALKTKSTISLSSLQEDIESYLSDQLFMRDDIVAVRSELMYALGRRDINGCYLCGDRFMQKITDSEVNIEACEKYADRINKLAENTDTYVMFVPSAGIVQSSFLPKNAGMYDYDSLYKTLVSRMNNAKPIDVKSVLDYDGAYYLTDHHWTSDGAYSAYVEWCNSTGNKPYEYELEEVSNDFRGTLYSKALIKSELCDTIKAPDINYNITVVADGQPIMLYDKAALETKDKYNYFEGGNHGIMTIENNDVNNSKVLLILKDSFANSFVPYLIPHYHKIIMLDERYTFESPNDVIEREGVNQILVLKEIYS